MNEIETEINYLKNKPQVKVTFTNKVRIIKIILSNK